MRNNLVFVAAASLALLSGVLADQCAAGSALLGGNWYCQPVEAIRYMNVGTAGSYKEVIQMNSDGTCKRRAKPFSGPLSPLDEEVSLHFRGPIRLKQLAAYTPSAPKKKTRRVLVPESLNHANKHQQMHRDLKAKANENEQAKKEMVTATINSQTVSWENNWFGDTAHVRSKAPDMVTATINGQIVSWVNNYFGPETLATGTTPAAAPATQNPEPEKTKSAEPNVVAAAPKSQVQGQAAGVAPAVQKGSTSASNPVPDTKNSNVVPAAKVIPTVDTAKGGYTPKPVKDTSNQFDRIGFYHASSQVCENLVFLGNHGGQGSGVFDYKFGASLAYANRKGTGGAASPQVLADVALPSDSEVIVMMGQDCSDGSCGYTRPGGVAHHGFGGADKVFFMEFSMPKDGTTGFNADMPAIWMLNAQIPRTLQYGNADCSCWNTGCGEFDIAETLSSGSVFMKSTLHTNTPGGNSDYLVRPTTGTMKLAVIFDASEATANIQVLPQDYEFPTSLTVNELKKLVSDTAASKVSHFHIHSS